jgi:hypothetical protein
MNDSVLIAGLAVTATLCGTFGCAHSAELPLYAKKGQVIQRLRAFDNPEGSIFSADGQTVFIANSAELGMPDKGFHWTHNAGYISKLHVRPDGTLSMVLQQFITGLTGPLGMAVSTVATPRFPRGTIFLAEAWVPLAEADGTEVTDPKVLDPQILAFNVDGKVLGAIKIGAGSTAAKVSGVVGTLANSLAFDHAGNLYLAETGLQGTQFVPPVVTKGGGLYMIPLTSLDALADGREAPLYYIAVPNGGPDGIEVAPDGMIHFNTVGLNAGLKDRAAGGMYKLQQANFHNGTLPPPFIRGLGALDGLDFAGNKRLDTLVRGVDGVLVTPLGGNKTYRLGFDQDIQFAGPADIAIHKMKDGSYLMLIPELSGKTPNHRDNPVTVVKLPADF